MSSASCFDYVRGRREGFGRLVLAKRSCAGGVVLPIAERMPASLLLLPVFAFFNPGRAIHLFRLTATEGICLFRCAVIVSPGKYTVLRRVDISRAIHE